MDAQKTESKDQHQLLRAKGNTDAKKLALSIVSHRSKNPGQPVVIRAIGAGALNQAVKACIIANRFLISHGVTAYIHPSFNDITENETVVTAIELNVKFNKI